jgi:hypothetical protein
MTASPPLKIDESALDLLAGKVSNEVLHGFTVPDFGNAIGASKYDFQLIVVAVCGLSKGSEAFFDLRKAIIFRNALGVVLEELGVEEFHTRTGHDFEEGKAILQQLSSFIDIQPVGRD